MLSDQYFSSNALTYFQQFWNPEEQTLHCYNLPAYIRFIDNSAYWPFKPSNLNGMSFFDYFKGIREMSCNEEIYSISLSTQSAEPQSFNDEFSYYILEQLFSPVSFIDNLSLHQKVFSDLFSKYKESSREKSILLLRPLFHLPHSLWERLSAKYVEALRNYIVHPSDRYYIAQLKANMSIVLYYKQYLFPLLLTIVGNYLYSVKNEDLNAIKELISDYFNTQPDVLSYKRTFLHHMKALASMTYPNNAFIDVQGNYMLCDWKYRQADCTSRATLAKPKKPKGDEGKRNNKSISTYELNFTYQFFNCPEPSDFFEYEANRQVHNIDGYLFDQFVSLIHESNNIKSGESTFNYKQKIANDNGGILLWDID